MMKALSIQGLEKTYGNGFQAVKDVNLDVEEGDFFALLGPNGAGKSTTIGIICSLIKKTRGKVSVFGHDLEREREAVKSSIGLVPQEFNFSLFEPPIEILINQAGYYGIPRPEARRRAEVYLKKMELWEQRDNQSRSLSGGMKRRLMIARALIHEPRLLFLDEPTAGVDIEIRRSMWAFVQEINKELGTTIILTTHYLEEAESLCRNVAVINEGVVIQQGAVSHLLSESYAQTYVLDISQSMDTAPDLEGFSVYLLGNQQLEVEVTKEHHLNKLFAVLSSKKLDVTSMRTKTNRLEEFFMRLVKKG
ncbi:MAG: ABC transporter ATP-binding protein [Gammaproteobacteria bacterium]|nr:ABC transporter ATP-binding protein [Gammaproteobacteria bacterium]